MRPSNMTSDAVGQREQLVEVLADQQHGRAARCARRRIAVVDLGDGGEVEAEEGLAAMSTDDLLGQLAREHRALDVAARQRADRRVGAVRSSP